MWAFLLFPGPLKQGKQFHNLILGHCCVLVCPFKIQDNSRNLIKMVQKTIQLETDYLVIGGGAMCMAFVDEILYGSRTFGNIFIRF